MKKRLCLMLLFFAAALTALSIRIGFLQLYDDEPLAVMAEGQYLTELGEVTQRAGIYDREGREITGGKIYAYYYISEDVGDETENEDGMSDRDGEVSVSKEKDGVSEEAAERKAGGEKESDSDLGQSLKTAGEQKNDDLPEGRADLLKQLGCELVRPYENGYCVWKGEYSRRNQARIEAEYGALTVRKQERYADSQPAVHLLGYTAGTGDNGEEEGQCGLEKMYDQRLSKGAVRKYLSRAAAGNILRGSGILSDSEISGRFQISIDLKLQEKAEELLAENGRPGAVVVSSAETGEILASASYPVYNPNDVGGHLTSEKNELIDRVSAGTYPPGSVFKLVVAAAALEAGIADEDSVFECSGSIETGGITVRCSTGGEGGHGRITLRQALADSCNCAFIQLGMETGGQRIIEMAESMGLGADVCPQLSESTGHLPADAEECGIANLSIGQGTILATPLQITSVMNCVASGGIRLPLKILMPETEQDLIKYDVCPDILRESAEQNSEGIRVLSERTAASLLSMMRDTTESGTAQKISEYTEELPGGKTGSAQSSMSGQTVVHGWFSGFFPQTDPEYVITVFLENGGGGGACLPVAGGLIRFLSGEAEIGAD